MKNPAAIVASIAALAAGGFAIHQSREVARITATLDAVVEEAGSLRTKAEVAEAARRKAAEEAEAANTNVERLQSERDSAVEKLAKAPVEALEKPAPPAAEDKAAGFAKGISEMFKGEEGKKMLRAQTEFGSRMVYGDFIKTLDPAMADAVMALLTDRQVALATLGMEAMSGGNPEAAGPKIQELKTEYDKKLRAMIGDAKMSELEASERTAGDRMMFAQVESQFAASGTPLSPEQRTGVLNLMKEERLKAPASAIERGHDNPAEMMKVIQDEKAVDNWLASEERLNATVLSRARQILSPDQILLLETSFKQMTEMKKFGVKMWQKK